MLYNILPKLFPKTVERLCLQTRREEREYVKNELLEYATLNSPEWLRLLYNHWLRTRSRDEIDKMIKEYVADRSSEGQGG